MRRLIVKRFQRKYTPKRMMKDTFRRIMAQLPLAKDIRVTHTIGRTVVEIEYFNLSEIK